MKYVLAVLLCFAASAFAAYDVRVIDGDTINVPVGAVIDMPGRITVRLVGINTPETRGAKCAREKRLGEEAKTYVRERFEKATRIKIEFVRKDKYGGRVVGRVNLDEKDLGEDLVKAGFAVSYGGGRRDLMVWCQPVAKPKVVVPAKK